MIVTVNVCVRLDVCDARLFLPCFSLSQSPSLSLSFAFSLYRNIYHECLISSLPPLSSLTLALALALACVLAVSLSRALSLVCV
jgi:hypothetical protein